MMVKFLNLKSIPFLLLASLLGLLPGLAFANNDSAAMDSILENNLAIDLNVKPTLRKEESPNFMLDFEKLSQGDIQMGLSLVDQGSIPEEFSFFNSIDVNGVYSKGNKIFASKVAYIIDADASRFTMEELSSPQFVKSVFNVLSATLTSEYDSTLKTEQAITFGPFTLSRFETYFKHTHYNKEKNTINNTLLRNLTAADDATVGRYPEQIHAVDLTYCSDKRFTGSLNIVKVYRIASNKSLVISYIVGSSLIDISRLIRSLVIHAFISNQYSDAVNNISKMRKYFH